MTFPAFPPIACLSLPPAQIDEGPGREATRLALLERNLRDGPSAQTAAPPASEVHELRAEMQALRKCEPAASWLTPGLADSGVFVCRTTAEEEQSLASHRVSTDAACARLARDLRVMIALSDIAWSVVLLLLMFEDGKKFFLLACPLFT